MRAWAYAAACAVIVMSPACGSREGAGARAPSASPEDRLAAMIDGAPSPGRVVPGAAVAIWLDGAVVWSAAAGAASLASDGLSPARPMRADTPVRAASISKLVTALTAQALERQGVVDLDAPIAPLLGFEPVSPAFDAALERVTLRMALAHTSGLCDPDPYWAPLGRSLQSLLGPQALCDHAPGEGWAYANINYALVAQALETATGERFDILAGRLVLDPLGLDAGFNWSGVSTERRAGGATLYRRHDGLWTAQIDDAQSLAASGPAIRRSGDDALDLADYTPGTNGTLFSPQGGLRASVTDLARLAAVFAPGGTGEALTEPVWIGAVSPGVRAWGSGPQIMTAGQTPGRADLVLVGHAGEAYGLYAGAWAIASRNAAVAFAVTGTDAASDTRRDDVSGLTHWEAELLAIALDQLDALTAAPGMDGSAP